MNLTVLVIMACSFAGRPCREYQLSFADLPVLTCTLASQPIVAQWQSQNPFLYPKKWWCEIAGSRGKA